MDGQAAPRGTLAAMTSGPEVRADGVVFRLPDRGYSDVRLLQELERPRNGPPLHRTDGGWELTYRRPQVDRMEYRFEADGEPLADPGNPRRAGDRSVVEFPGYAPPAWLGAADPGPAAAIAPHTRLWSPPGTDPRRSLPLLVAHDGSGYAQDAQLPRLIAHAIERGRIPPCRIALLDSPARDEDYSASARYAHRLAATLPRLAPASAFAGVGASLGALALLHTHWLHPGAFGALLLQSGSYFRQRWDAQESGFPRFRRIARFAGTVLNAQRAAAPIPVTLTCGAPEENLANNRAVASALRRQGHPVALHVNRDAHNWTAWRDVLDPHLVDLLARAWG
jgi:enterochelin esterase family protein